MCKKFHLLIMVLLTALNLYAQNTEQVLWLKASEVLDNINYDAGYGLGIPVKSKETADGYRTISPDSNDKEIFIIKDYYLNGQLRFRGVAKDRSMYDLYPGNREGYFKNGKRKFIETYRSSDGVINVTQYYPNGQVHLKTFRDKTGKLFLDECHDSTGVITAKNGSGKWIKYDEDHRFVTGKGEIRNGAEAGKWEGMLNDSTIYKCIYEKGQVISGTSTTKSGLQYAFNKQFVIAEYKDEMEGFYNFLALHIHYLKQAKNDNIQGRVFTSFIIERDGALSCAATLRGLGGGLDEEAIRVIQLTAKSWKPALQFGIPVRCMYTVPTRFSSKD
jgi:antitoxin component YwqK of YwqJK toxin-antitoxin module